MQGVLERNELRMTVAREREDNRAKVRSLCNNFAINGLNILPQ